MLIRLSTFSSSTPGILPILSWMNSECNHHPPIVKHVFVYISGKSMWTCLKPHLAMNGDWEGRSASTAGRGIQNAVARRRGDHLHDLVDAALPMGGLKKNAHSNGFGNHDGSWFQIVLASLVLLAFLGKQKIFDVHLDVFMTKSITFCAKRHSEISTNVCWFLQYL